MLKTLTARFDLQALNPPRLSAAPPPDQHPAWAALSAFCAPVRQPRWAVATLSGDGATALADAFACMLDGSVRLAGLGRAAGIAWRLQVKLQDVMPWRGLQPGDPWDAGWARSAPASVRWLAKGFEPRRATLLLSPTGERGPLTLPVATLAQRSDQMAHPLRWLWVEDLPDEPLRLHSG